MKIIELWKRVKKTENANQRIKVGETLVSDEWYDELNQYSWGLSKEGYATRVDNSSGKPAPIRMHRVVLGLSRYDDKICDHINQNRLDNQVSNLRIVTKRENVMNRKLQPDGTWHSAAHKRKIAIANTGRLHTEETKKQLSQSKIGKKLDAVTKAKMAASHTGVPKGPMSEETKMKISKAKIEGFNRRKGLL